MNVAVKLSAKVYSLIVITNHGHTYSWHLWIAEIRNGTGKARALPYLGLLGNCIKNKKIVNWSVNYVDVASIKWSVGRLLIITTKSYVGKTASAQQRPNLSLLGFICVGFICRFIFWYVLGDVGMATLEYFGGWINQNQ